MASVDLIKRVANHALVAVYAARRDRRPNTAVTLSQLLDKFLHEPREQKLAALTFREKSCQDVVSLVIFESKINNLNGRFDRGTFYFSWPDAQGTPTE